MRWLYRLGQAAALQDGDVFGDRAALREALVVLREHALPLTPEGSPARRATLETTVSLLDEIGDQENDATVLREAVALARSLVASANQANDPDAWAVDQRRLGNTLRSLGEHRRDRAVLREAAQAYERAMEVYTRATHPDEWALTQNNLGNVLRIQAELGDRRTLPAAIAAYRAALDGTGRSAHSSRWAAARANLAIALRMVGDRASIEQSVVSLREVVAARNPAREPGPWAYTQYQLALSLEAGADDHPGWRAEALSSAHAAVEIYSRMNADGESEARALLRRLEED